MGGQGKSYFRKATWRDLKEVVLDSLITASRYICFSSVFTARYCTFNLHGCRKASHF